MNIINKIIARHQVIASGIQSVNKILWKQSAINKIVSVRTPQNITKKYSSILNLAPFSRNNPNEFSNRLRNLLPRVSAVNKHPSRDIHESTPKKRIGLRKRRSEHHEKLQDNGYFSVMAFATAEEYDLEKLLVALQEQNLYEPKKFFNSDDSSENQPDVLYATAKYQVGKEPRGIYFFREGTVVMWNFSDMESSNILGFLKNFEQVKKLN